MSDRIPNLNKTVGSFTDDKKFTGGQKPEIGRDRADDIRRDKDTEKNVKISLLDIDFSIKEYITEVIKPMVETLEGMIPVPVIYAGGEKWVSIQELGYMKDEKGKTIAPAIAFRRSSVNSSEIKFPKIATIKDVYYMYGSSFSRSHPYDKFSILNNITQPKVRTVTPAPEFVDLTYDFTIWTDMHIQMNDLVEQFIWFGGNFFGEKNLFKFYSDFDSTSFETTNVTGEDRLVKSSFQLKTKAYILPLNAGTNVTTQKIVSPSRIVFLSESATDEYGFDLSVNGHTNPKSPDVYPYEGDETNL